MNKHTEQEMCYRLLKILSQRADFTQREMAARMGISLGKVNYCLTALVKKGFIKTNRFKASENKLQYLYHLTPRGLEAKAGLTLSFLKRKMAEYDEIKRQIQELTREVQEVGLVLGPGDNVPD